MMWVLALALTMLAAQGCPTQTVYRRPLPPPSSEQRPLPPGYPPAPDYSQPPPQARAPIERGPIYEEDLKERRLVPPPRSLPEPSARTLPPQVPSPPQALSPPAAPPLPEETSLLAKITAATPPQRAASIRLTEEGRKLLESGDHARAMSRLEKNHRDRFHQRLRLLLFGKAHASLGRQQESLRFSTVAESLFSREPYWLAEVFALRGENYRTLGAVDRAGQNYSQALRLNPGNRLAAAGLARLQEEGQPGLR